MRPFNPRSLRVAALAFVAASLYACSSDSPTSPGDAQPPELTAVLSEATQPSLGEIGAIVAPTSRLVSALAPSLSTPVPSNCGYDGTSQSFVCARVTYNGLTVEHSFTLFDAAGNRQSQFSPGSTASVQTRSHVTGTLTLPTGSTTMDAVDDRTVSGLLTGKHVLNGVSTSQMSGTFAGLLGSGQTSSSQTMSSTSTAKIENLVLPSAGNRWPGPGTVTMDATSSLAGLPATTSHMVMTFNGTKCVTASSTYGGFSSSSTLDLSNLGASFAGTGCTP